MKNLSFFILVFFLSFLSPAFAAYDNLYLVGNATEAGWDPDAAIPMEKQEPGIFTWTGTLSDYSIDEGRFKFLVSNKWEPSITCRIDIAGHLLVESGKEYDLYERATANDGFDNAFQVPVTGVYTIRVDLNTMKMVCTGGDVIARENWEYVRPEIGADGEGHVFPGVCVPFGMVKLGADCGDRTNNSGWGRGGNIQGFSHLHVSGTGGGPKYGNILFQPMTGDLNLSDYSSARSNERFGLGLYEVSLSKYNVGVRLTASAKAGFHEYTFPQSESSKILIDAGSCLTLHVESQELVASGVKILSNKEIEGYSTVKGGWNLGGPYTVYFYALLDTPADEYTVWKGTSVQSGEQVDATGTEKTGAYFGFHTTEGQKVRVKVGISFISTEKAKANISELPSWDFDEIRNAGIAQWKVDVNWAKNNSEVISLASGMDYMTLTSVQNSVELRIVKGKPLVSLYCREPWKRNELGQVLVGANGRPLSGEAKFLADVEPKWTGSIRTSLRWKDLSFSAMFDIRMGGNVWSETAFVGSRNAETIMSLGGREAHFFSKTILNENDQTGYLGILDSKYVPNGMSNIYMDASRPKGMNIPGAVYDSSVPGLAGQPCQAWIEPINYWTNDSGRNGELYLYDASYVKLKEISLGYNIPKSLLRKIGFIQSMRISAVGRNVAILHQNTPKGIDPEATSSMGIQQGLERGFNLPTATYGFDFKITF